jgi:anti-sigma factor RsiW
MTCTFNYVEHDWMNYIQGQMNAEKEAKLEQHLPSCEKCLQTYEEVLYTSIPNMEHEFGETPPNMTNEIMSHVHDISVIPHRKKRQVNLLFHYGLAASIVLLFMHFGLFDKFTAYSFQVMEFGKNNELWFINLSQSTEHWFTNLTEKFTTIKGG